MPKHLLSYRKRTTREVNIIKGVLLAIFAVVLAVVAWFAWGPPANRQEVNSFEDCISHNNVVLEIYPAVCRTKDGRSFTDPRFNRCAVMPDPPPNCEPKTGHSRY